LDEKVDILEYPLQVENLFWGLSTEGFFAAVLLADRLIMNSLIFDLCECLVGRLQVSLSGSARRCEASRYQQAGLMARRMEKDIYGCDLVELEEYLGEISLLPDHLQHQCEAAIIRAVPLVYKIGTGAGVVVLEPPKEYMESNSGFADRLCCFLGSCLKG
jgi:hypothetical protein